MPRPTKDGEKVYKCDSCGAEYQNHRSLWKHKNRKNHWAEKKSALVVALGESQAEGKNGDMQNSD